MVQPKYSPEEALERVKLMMKYDLSKTSVENKILVSEQTTTLTPDDLSEGGKFVKLGMKGDIVGKIQELLISKGYKDISKSGKVDNSFGERTKKMVTAFQVANGLEDDGVVGGDTWSKLNDGRAVQSGTKTSLACVKKFYQVHDSFVPTQDLGNSFRVHIIPFESEMADQGVTVWDFKFENGVGEWNQLDEGQITERGTFNCLDDQHFRMNKENGSNKFTSKRSDGSPKISRKSKIDNPSYKLKFGPTGEPESKIQQTQTNTSDPLSCVKNYFRTKTFYYYKNAKYTQASVYGTGELEVTLPSNLTWKFLTWKDGKKTWKQYTDGDLSDNGVWSCDGDSNFTMRSVLGNFNFDSKNAEEFFKQIQSGGQPTQAQPVAQPTQTQPVAQPTQTGPAAGYTDANQQSTLRRQDSILSDILDNQSVNKSVCRKNITDFYDSFKQKNSIVVDPATIAKAKRIVQACRDQHYGKFGVLGKGGERIDNMLDILSGRKEGGPLTQGSDSMWRIK